MKRAVLLFIVLWRICCSNGRRIYSDGIFIKVCQKKIIFAYETGRFFFAVHTSEISHFGGEISRTRYSKISFVPSSFSSRRSSLSKFYLLQFLRMKPWICAIVTCVVDSERIPWIIRHVHPRDELFSSLASEYFELYTTL